MEMWPVGPVRFLLEVVMMVFFLMVAVGMLWMSLGSPNVFAQGGHF